MTNFTWKKLNKRTILKLWALYLNPFRIPWYKIFSSYRSTLTVFGALKLGEIGFGKSSNCSHPNLMKTWFELPALWKLSHKKAMQLVNESVEEKCQIQWWPRVVELQSVQDQIFFKDFAITLQLNISDHYLVTVWKSEKFSLTEKFFRQINYLVISLESIQSNGDIFESDIPQHRWLFEL